MAMPIGDANAVNTLIHWAMGQQNRGWPGSAPVSDADATNAASLLAIKAYKALGAGLIPDQVRLSTTGTVRERLLQICAAEVTAGRLDETEGAAINTVLNVLDRIERVAATTAGEESS